MIINFHDTSGFRDEVKKNRNLLKQLSCWAHAIDCLNNELWTEAITIHIHLENNLVMVTSANLDLMHKLNRIFESDMYGMGNE